MTSLFDGPDAPAIVQEEQSEQQLIETSRAADSAAAWVVGECAFLWTQKYAKGRKDSDFARMIGMESEQVAQRRRVYEAFADVRVSYTCMKFSHFRAALAWDDSAECLAWADENGANVAEMMAFHRMQNGEDLTVEADPPETVPNTGGRTEREAPESRPVGQSSVPAVDEPVDAPRAAEPKLDKAPAQKKKPAEATPEPVKPPGIGEAIEAVTRLADELRDEHERKRFAGHLRKQADLLDPPRVNGKFVAPTVYEVSSYATENSLSLDGQAFVDFYESKGWLVGRVKMKDWRAAARNWSRRDSNGTNGFSANRSVARVAPIDHGPERIDVDYTTGEGVEEDESFDPSNPFGV